MSYLNRTLCSILLLLALTSVNCKKSGTNNDPAGPVELQEKVVANNLDYPWEILWAPDNQIWFTEREGQVSRLDPATGVVTPVYAIPDVVANGEGGLLGMALHPSFTTTPQVFVVYDYTAGGSYREKVVRFNYTAGTLTNPFIVIENLAASNIHNGSRLLIVDDKIFITTGDASDQSLPQNETSRNGKILRLNLDGSIPADNPFPNNPFWSLGHRNPQGLVFANNTLYSSEHGPDSDDEINLIEKNRNYGWPDVRGFCDESSEQSFCSSKNVREPLKAWTPTIATSGLDYYNSDLIPQWKNSLLLTTLKDATLYQMSLSGDFRGITSTNTYLRGDYGRLRDLCVSPDGKVYVCTSNGGDDKIVELKPK